VKKITTIIVCFLALSLISRAAISLTKPKNSYIYENNWYCYSGYHKSGNSCIKTINIPNATRIPNSNDWYCKSGYEREGSSCIEIMKIPANAYRYGGRWICKSGYEKLGQKCIKISNIANSFQSGGEWYCNTGYEKSEGSCIKPFGKKVSSKKTSSDDLFKNIVTLLSIFGEAASSATKNLPSPSYNSVTPSFNSNSNNSSGYKSSFGNTYQYDLSNPLDRIKYESDPRAQIRDRTSNQYIKELESNLGQSGGGIFNNNNSPSWNNNSNGYNPSKSFNNNAPTWDWVD
jgi:hypothetical protein